MINPIDTLSLELLEWYREEYLTKISKHTVFKEILTRFIFNINDLKVLSN